MITDNACPYVLWAGDTSERFSNDIQSDMIQDIGLEGPCSEELLGCLGRSRIRDLAVLGYDCDP
jgi:hypothetical protein